MTDQLVLTEDTLGVIASLMPTDPLCGPLLALRDGTIGTATLSAGEVRHISRTLDTAMTDAAAVAEHCAELRAALDRVGLGPLATPERQTVPVVLAGSLTPRT
jgi:hypothetical protein